VLLNASPDLRQQFTERQQLHPAANSPKRASPVAGVVLTGADVDLVAGLLTLRESQPLSLYAHQRVLTALADNNIFNVLNSHLVRRIGLPLEETVALTDHDNVPLGLEIVAFAVPGKAALWLEDVGGTFAVPHPGDTIGLRVSAKGSRSFFCIPGCASISPELAQRLKGAELALFDGTLWRDDEMIAQGVGTKTGYRMGHVSCSGLGGTIAALSNLNIVRKVFIHVNNTNPLLIEDSRERAEAKAAGWEVAYDGMEFTL
jgi:pyrroloquinoline quinone biosynthesis protein B